MILMNSYAIYKVRRKRIEPRVISAPVVDFEHHQQINYKKKFSDVIILLHTFRFILFFVVFNAMMRCARESRNICLRRLNIILLSSLLFAAIGPSAAAYIYIYYVIHIA